jgi:mono/diheme cytochrome c family protein
MPAALLLVAALTAQQPSAPPAASLDYETYETQVEPIFLAKREGLVRCVQCHGRGGGSGFNLQPLPEGATSWTEEQTRRNFEAASRWVTPGDPTASRLLMHPLARTAGGDPFHGGGKHFPSQDAPEWQTLAAWVRRAAASPAQTAGGGTATTLDFDFYWSRVEPILLKPRGPSEGSGQACVGCHASVATRMRLQPLPPGATAWTAEQSRQNFAVVSRLVTPGDPLASRLLLHPLAVEAGGDPQHTGGKFWPAQSHPEWQTIAQWVKTAAPGAAGPATRPAALDFDFFKTRVQPIFTTKREGLVRCVQCHAGGSGSGLRLQPLPKGAATWTDEQSRQNFESASRLVTPGDPTASRLLMHPLSRAAGGDPFHGGGKHWTTQEAAEWQTLAEWVSGRGVAGSSR